MANIPHLAKWCATSCAPFMFSTGRTEHLVLHLIDGSHIKTIRYMLKAEFPHLSPRVSGVNGVWYMYPQCFFISACLFVQTQQESKTLAEKLRTGMSEAALRETKPAIFIK